MRVMLATLGTRGDVQPMAALARGLGARGHEVLLAATPNNENWAARADASYAPIGRDIQAFLTEHIDEGINPLKNVRLLKRMFLEDMPRSTREFVGLAREFAPDLVVHAGLAFGAPTAAAAVSARAVWVPYTPAMLPSPEHAPGIMPVADKPRAVNRALWWVAQRMIMNWIEAPIAEVRREMGLAPPDRPMTSVPDHFFCAWAESVAGPPPPAETLPQKTQNLGISGHLSWHSKGELDAHLAHFLDGGEPPIYVGFGSMPDTDFAATARIAVQAARAVGRRLVLLSGWSPPAELDDAADVFVGQRAPHEKLFARCALIAHHGGAGTTHTAARSGRPQVVVPHLVDQFDWASRVHARGLAPKGLPKTKLNVARLTERFAAALELDEPACVGRALRAVDGVANACALLEELFQSS